MAKGLLTRVLLNALDRASRLVHRPREAVHITTGRRGEDAAYFHLRELGYTVVARNWRTARRRGEIDIVAWDGGTLCFVEVKTRTSRDVKPAEAAVNHEKRREIAAMGREYLRRLRLGTPFRFDVVSIYLEPGQKPIYQVFKNAYSWRSMKSGNLR